MPPAVMSPLDVIEPLSSIVPETEAVAPEPPEIAMPPFPVIILSTVKVPVTCVSGELMVVLDEAFTMAVSVFTVVDELD